MLKKFWHLWALSLGEKAHKDDDLADKVAIIRTILFAQVLITNFFIVGGVVINVASVKRHWNNNQPTIIEVKIYENENYAEELHTKEWNHLGMERNSRAEGVYRTAKIKTREFE